MRDQVPGQHATMRYVLTWVLLAAVAMSWPAAGTGPANEDGPTVLLLTIDGLAWEDISWSPDSAWRALAAVGGIGVANVRPAALGQVPGSGHLSLGRGHKSAAGSMAGLAFMRDETYAGILAADLYVSLSGADSAPAIVHIGWAEQEAGLQAATGSSSGKMLGQNIGAAGYPVWALGNADTWEAPGRYGVLVATDDDGTVARGDVGSNTLLWDPSWPFGWRTNYEVLWEHVTDAVSAPGLAVVQLGDLARLQAAQPFMTPAAAARSRRVALGRISDFIHNIIAHATAQSRPVHALIVSPGLAPADDAMGFLTPVFYAVVGGANPPTARGVLLSPTTRRPGVIVDVDVTATVLSLFGLPHDGTAGRPMATKHKAHGEEAVAQLYDTVVRVHRQRLSVIQPYFYLQLLAVVLATVVLVWGRRRLALAAMCRRPLIPGFAAMMAWPLAVLLLPVFPWPLDGPGLGLILAVTTASVVAVGWLLTRGDVLGTLTCISVATTVALAYDALTGAFLMQRSHLGYDVIIGARFYGMGNEYMGLFLGSAIMAAGGILDMSRADWHRPLRYAVTIAFAGIVLILASPAHGANVGGTVGAICCFVSVLILFGGRKLRFAHAMYAALGLATVMGGAAWYDMTRHGPNASHLGQFVRQLSATRGHVLWPVVQRKVAMNVRLIRLTVWGRAFLVSLVSSLYFVFWLPPTWRHLANSYPYTVKAMQGGIVGAVAVLLSNDSGIVAAAMLMIPLVSTLLALSLHNGRDRRLNEGIANG